jgi:Fic family protein
MYRFTKTEYEKRMDTITAFLDKTNISHIPQSILLQNENRHRLSFIVSSVAIEGNTFTIDEARKLLDRNIVSSNRSFDEHRQIVNYHNAYNEMLELSSKNAPLDIPLICRLHGLVSAGEVKSAGILREQSVYIGNSARVVHTPIGHEHVEIALENALDAYRESTEDVLTRIVTFHLEFEHIHPFEDGNGRTGRLIMNYQLLQNGYFQIHIPSSKRSLYMAAFKDYNRTTGKIDKMLDIVSREQEKTIAHIQELWNAHLGKKDIDAALEKAAPPRERDDDISR